MRGLTDDYELFAAIGATWRRRSDEDIIAWAERNVIPPGSARGSRFDASATPWLIEPLRTMVDEGTREQVCIMPTGAGKTTLFDVSTAWELLEDPGSILLTLQNDDEADAYWEERLLPILEAIPEAFALISSLQKSKKKRGQIILPSSTLYCSSLKLRALQRKSVRRVKIDEAWMAAHGFIAEARARMHDRWNRIATIVSQGGNRFVEKAGEIMLSELEEAMLRTDRREYSMVCPECGDVSPWSHSGLLYENAETASGGIDEAAILQSARYKCPGRCGTEFPDKIEVRRQLSTGSIYVPKNEQAIPGHIGYHVHGYGIYYVSWGERALRWKRSQMAKRHGDLEPLKIIIQKDFAEFWEEHEHRFSGFTSDAPESDYVIEENQDRYPGLKAGFPWTIEEQRFLVGDYQELDGRYFVAAAAAFAKSGESRIIHAARINSVEELRDKQTYLGISGRRVGIDCADNTADVNSFCRKYDWLELLGSDRKDWPHTEGRRVFYLPWSRPERIGGVKDGCWRALWSNPYFHDLHARRLANAGLSYGVPADIEDMAAYIDPGTGKPTGFWPQMRANHKVFKESKDTGKRTSAYIRIGKRPDHYRDARCFLLVMAGIGGCLGEVFESPRENQGDSSH